MHTHSYTCTGFPAMKDIPHPHIIGNESELMSMSHTGSDLLLKRELKRDDVSPTGQGYTAHKHKYAMSTGPSKFQVEIQNQSSST